MAVINYLPEGEAVINYLPVVEAVINYLPEGEARVWRLILIYLSCPSCCSWSDW